MRLRAGAARRSTRSTSKAEWGGSASQLAAYALRAACSESTAEAHRRGPGPSLCKLPDQINGGATPPAKPNGLHGGLGLRSARLSADERHINRDLPASKGREPIRHDLEPAPVGQWQPEVQVAEEDVGRDRQTRRGALQGASATDQQAARWPLAHPALASSGSEKRRRRRRTSATRLGE